MPSPVFCALKYAHLVDGVIVMHAARERRKVLRWSRVLQTEDIDDPTEHNTR